MDPRLADNLVGAAQLMALSQGLSKVDELFDEIAKIGPDGKASAAALLQSIVPEFADANPVTCDKTSGLCYASALAHVLVALLAVPSEKFRGRNASGAAAALKEELAERVSRVQRFIRENG